MDEKPEALRLADVLWPWHEGRTNNLSLAAAELRRLHDLADKYKWQVRDTCVRAEKAEAQRDELLEVLKEVVPMLEVALMIVGEPEPGSIGYKARAAIAKAEGK